MYHKDCSLFIFVNCLLLQQKLRKILDQETYEYLELDNGTLSIGKNTQQNEIKIRPCDLDGYVKIRSILWMLC